MLHLLPHHASLLPVPPTMPPCDGASVCPIHAEPLCSQVEVGHHPSSPVYWLRRFMQEEAVWCHLKLTGSVTSVSGSRGSTLTSSCHPRCRHRGPLHEALSLPSTLHASAREPIGADVGWRETMSRCAFCTPSCGSHWRRLQCSQKRCF
jgi:hypothetical protein